MPGRPSVRRDRQAGGPVVGRAAPSPAWGSGAVPATAPVGAENSVGRTQRRPGRGVRLPPSGAVSSTASLSLPAWAAVRNRCAPRRDGNSGSELPNSPLAAASQITTETLSPTAIFSSGAGRYSLKRSRNAGRGRAASTSTTASSILTTLKAISPSWFACATTSSRCGNSEQPASSSASADRPAINNANGTQASDGPQPPRPQRKSNRPRVEFSFPSGRYGAEI